MTQNRPIIIVGGGLAGLAAAQAIATFGLKAEVYEAAPQLGEIGAAVNVSPNASKALEAIGVGDKIAAVGNSSPGIYTRNMQTGEFLEFRDRREVTARYKRPYYTFHRADLLDALASGLDPRSIHLGHRLDRPRGTGRRHPAHLREWGDRRCRCGGRRRRRALGRPPSALWR